MKVLFLTNTPSPYRVDFFNELGKLCNLTVLFETPNARSRDTKWTADTFKNFRALFLKGMRIGEAEALCPQVINYLSLKKYDVIVVGMYSSPSGMLAIEYMKVMHIPFILNSDGGMLQEEKEIQYKIKRHLISAASAWLSTGDLTTEYFCHYGANLDKIYKYPFTSIKKTEVLNRPLTDYEKMNFKNKLGVTEQKMVLSVGQFIYRKGYDLLLNSCNNLNENIGVYIVGGIPTKEYLKLKEDLGLDNVHFLDFKTKNELVYFYKAADAFVLPTRKDIWGLVINEAMAYGLPVVTTNKCVAGLEMIKPNVNGILVPVEDSRSLSIAIEKVLKFDPQNSLNTAKNYTIEKMVESHIDCFEKFIAQFTLTDNK